MRVRSCRGLLPFAERHGGAEARPRRFVLRVIGGIPQNIRFIRGNGSRRDRGLLFALSVAEEEWIAGNEKGLGFPLKLATRPDFTGSDTLLNAIGIVAVAALAASAELPPPPVAAITAT